MLTFKEINSRRPLLIPVVILLTAIFSLTFVIATHTVTLSDGANSTTVDEDVDVIYNITVTNSDITVNITEVNVAFRSSFTFLYLSSAKLFCRLLPH